MCVDVSRQNEFAFAIDHAGAFRRANGFGMARRCDSVAVDYDRRVLDNLRFFRIDQCAVHERDLFRTRRQDEDRQCDSGCGFNFHQQEIPRLSLGMTKMN